MLLVLFALLSPRPSGATPGFLTTFAGGTGDNAPAGVGRLFRPGSVAIDPAGDIYISDTGNNRIRKVDVRGIITTVAGTGVPGFSGDGGDATKAQLNGPSGIALDPSGSALLIADTGNNRIRMLVNGVITTFAGTGPGAFSGDKDLAIKARLNHPSGVAYDTEGNVYIADTWNNRIRVVAQDGVISTFAGDGVPGFSGDKDFAYLARFNAPLGVTTAVVTSSTGGAPTVAPGVTKTGPGVVVYIADTGNNRIRRVDQAGRVATVAGSGTRGLGGDGGAATAAKLNTPQAVAFDTDGSMLIADTGNNRVRSVDRSGVIHTAAGSIRGFGGDGANAIGARMSAPRGLAVSRGTVFVADSLNNRLRAFTNGGYIATIAGSGASTTTGDGGHALGARLLIPTATAIGPGGVVYIADAGDHRVRKVDANGTVTTVAGTGVAGFSGDGRSARAAKLNAPEGVAVDGAGNLYISDTMNARIRRVDRRGIITTVAGTGAWGYGGDGGPGQKAKLLIPTGLAVDRFGNLFIADTANNRIRKLTPRGIITTVAGNGGLGYAGEGAPAPYASLNRPFGVAVDADGNIYIADTFNHRVRVVGTTGVITTFAGSNGHGFFGDGGPANMAQLNSPFGVAIAGKNIYIADSGNRRVRVVTPDDVIVTVAGNGQTTPVPDGIAGAAATLIKPVGVTITPSGLLISDAGDFRVRFLERTPVE